MTSPILFVPGMMLDGRVYAQQIEALVNTRSCHVADVSRASTIEAMASDILTAAPPRFALVGLSMGGIIALEIMRRAAERVTHLGLFDTTHLADAPNRREVRLEQVALAERGLLKQVLIESLMPLYLADGARTNQPLLDLILQMGLDLGPVVFSRQSLALMHRSDSTDVLRRIQCPSLVLCGAEDRLCPPQLHFAMAQSIPHADFVLLRDAGHLACMERPLAVTAALRCLLERNA